MSALDRSRRNMIWLIGILLAGLAVRLIGIGTRGIIYDDAFTIFLSRQLFVDIIRGTAADTMPPLFYFLLHIWENVSQSIIWLRLLPIFLNLVSIFLLFKTVRLIIDEEAALWAAGVAAFSPILYYHSQDVRMYALATACLVGYFLGCATLHFQKLDKRKTWIVIFLTWLSGTTALYSHNLAGFALLIPNIVVLIRRDWKQLINLSFIQAAVLVAFLPWMLQLPQQLEKVQTAFWTPRPGLIEVFQVLLQFTVGLPIAEGWMVPASIAGLLVLSMGVYTFLKGKSPKSNKIALLVWLTVPGVIIFALSYLMQPIFVARGFLVSVYALTAILGVAVKDAPNKLVKWGMIGLIGFTSAIGIYSQATYSEFPRSPFEAAGRWMAIEHSDELIVHDTKLSYFPMRYYNPQFNQVFLADDSGSANDTLAEATQKVIGLAPVKSWQAAVVDHSLFTFLTFKTAIEEYREMGIYEHPVIAEIEKTWQLLSITEIGDLVLYRFGQ